MGPLQVKPLERRGFLAGAVCLMAAPVVVACRRVSSQAAQGDSKSQPPDTTAEVTSGTQIGQWLVPEGTLLSPTDFARLLAVMDALVPGDASSAGATLTHAAWYLDQLLGAFRTDPPRIYAGGPFSGRHGGLDGFAHFQPLTRVETLRWRTFLEGSKGLPEREWNGPVIGLLQRYQTGLGAIATSAQAKYSKELVDLSRDEVNALLDDADADFVQMAYEHAVEGTYGDPVYGGNAQLLGWKAIDYEGDRQPVGYTARQMSHPEEG